ncbi:nucleotidyltransferase [Synergistales bacterium]|nr:nucleotidyltransferase [Synergistales bacterium]
MNIIGIVAEYNPFHNGHALHIARVRALLGEPAPVAVVLSSAFTQRGLPALLDKWTRARAALLNGADLVLELPFVYACNGGAEFAAGAVDILAAARFVTHISFGMESEHSPGIENIIDVLLTEPKSFKENLKINLSRGRSYSASVAEALSMEFKESEKERVLEFFSSPNNSLAVSYMTRIKKIGYGLIPVPIKRVGAGYHDKNESALAGAASIREGFGRGDAWIENAMPASSFEALKEAKASGRVADADAFWALLRGILLRSKPEELKNIFGMYEGMENLFLKNVTSAKNYDDFIGRCVCARYTRGRLQRQAARVLVRLDRSDAGSITQSGPPYIRVLGYTAYGRQVLHEYGDGASVPIITRLAAAQGNHGASLAEVEFRAARIWECLTRSPNLRSETENHVVQVV